MTVSAPPPLPIRREIRPWRDGFLAALVVFGCFAGSALWIYYKARNNEMAHHQEVVESAARRAAGSVEPHVLLVEDGTLPASEGKATLSRLRAIEEKESPIARVTLLRPEGDDHLLLYDTDLPRETGGEPAMISRARAEKLVAHEVPHAADVVASGQGRSVVRPDGTVKAYAPIQDPAGKVVGVATAESAPHTLSEGLASIGWAVVSALVVGGILAALAWLVVYSVRLKSQKTLERLARTERADRLIVEAMGQIFYEHKQDTDGLSWRGELERIVGLPAELLSQGLDWQERIHPADREAFRQARILATSRREHFSVEYRMRRDDGDSIWLLDRGGWLPREDGQSGSVIGVILDVTASREAAQRLRDVVDAAGEYIWEVDARGHYTYLSGRVREVLGFAPEELLGRSPFDLVPPVDLAAVRARSEHLGGRQTAFRDFEHRVIRADGEVIWLSINGVPAFNADGVWSGYRGAGLDITSRKEAEQALIREKEVANAAVQAKSQFLAVMSHEIRTPLNSVLGFADLLAVSPLNQEQKDQVDLIRRSGDALLVLLNDILDFSRIESGGLALDVQDVDFRACLREVLDWYRPPAAARGLDLVLEVEEDLPGVIRTDPARLRQILLNLVGNAVKFTENGAVTVRVWRKPLARPGWVSVAVEVADTGIGIPPGKVDLLFQPFSQVDSSATRRFGGTGLGLAICRRLAELLGGEVGLRRSGPGGSVFFLELIAEVSGRPALRPREEEVFPKAAAASGRTKRFLVAEDHRVNRLLIGKLLASFHLPVDEAENGRDCLQMHERHPYDVILMDVQMPVLDGLEATRLIRENEARDPTRPRVLIIALTADAMTGDRERCLQAGMDDYLSKPIRTQALAAVLERHGLLEGKKTPPLES